MPLPKDYTGVIHTWFPAEAPSLADKSEVFLDDEFNSYEMNLEQLEKERKREREEGLCSDLSRKC